MKKRLVAVGLVMMLAASLLTGCGSTGDSSADTSGNDNAAKSSEASQSGDKIELSVWYYFVPDAEIFLTAVDDYNAMQDQVVITPTYVSREELMNQYTIGAVSGDLPDIGMVDSPDMASYISLGVFADITDELETWDELDHYYKGNLASCMDADGRIYGLPQNTNCIMLACNMDLLRKAGYDHIPVSLDELEEMAIATTDASDDTYGFAMSACSTEEGTYQLLPWLLGTHDGKSTTIADIDADSAVTGLTALSNIVSGGAMSTECINWRQVDVFNQFMAQKAAIAEIGTWYMSSLNEDPAGPGFDYQVGLLPTGDAGTTVSTIGGENFGVSSSCQHIEEAVDFVKWLCSAERERIYSEGSGKLPTRDDVTPEYSYLSDEEYAVIREQLTYAVARGPHESWPTISQAIYTMAQDVLLNGADPAAALKSAADVIDPILEETPILQY